MKVTPMTDWTKIVGDFQDKWDSMPRVFATANFYYRHYHQLPSDFTPSEVAEVALDNDAKCDAQMKLILVEALRDAKREAPGTPETGNS